MDIRSYIWFYVITQMHFFLGKIIRANCLLIKKIYSNCIKCITLYEAAEEVFAFHSLEEPVGAVPDWTWVV